MQLSEIIKKCEYLQKKLSLTTPDTVRPFCQTIEPESRGIIFTGARGVGKTTFLLQKFKQKYMLYIAADNPFVSSVSLYDLAEAAFLKGYEGICIDEIHYVKDWSRQLKAVYDSFPAKLIWASDSSSLTLKKGLADLSRRFLFIRLPLLSLREYLTLNTGNSFDKLEPFHDNTMAVQKIIKEYNILRIFQEYSRHGFRPIFKESKKEYPAKVMNTVFKSLDEDIPFLVPSVSPNHLRLMRAVLGYLGNSPIPRLNVSNLCAEWGISKEKLYQLLEAMELGQVIQIVRHKRDHAAHSAGAKIFFYEPSLYKTFMQHSGNFREALTVCAFRESGHSIWACKNEQQGDFIIDEIRVEIGGQKKKAKDADFVIREDIEIPVDNALPLWILGFIW